MTQNTAANTKGRVNRSTPPASVKAESLDPTTDMADTDTLLVPLKRVVDYNVRVRVKPDGSGVALDGVKMSINPFDEIALEEALRIRERGEAGSVVVASIGAREWTQQLRAGLAMGADRAILVESDQELEPLTVAKALLALVERENPRLVIMGKQAIDGDHNQTGQMLAALWDRPQATFTSELVLHGNVVTATREVDAGLEVVEVELPVVVTTDLRLNEPRYTKLPDIMKAKRKPLDTVSLEELGVKPQQQFQALVVEPPTQRPKGVMVDSVAELAHTLREKGLV